MPKSMDIGNLEAADLEVVHSVFGGLSPGGKTSPCPSLFEEPLRLPVTAHGGIGREGAERWVRGANDHEVVVVQLIGPAGMRLILGVQGLAQRLGQAP